MDKAPVLIIRSCGWELFNKQWDSIKNKFKGSEFWLFTALEKDKKLVDERFQRIIQITPTRRLNPFNHISTILALSPNQFQTVVCIYADSFGIDYGNVRLLMNMISAKERKAFNSKGEWIDIARNMQIAWDFVDEIQHIFPTFFLWLFKIMITVKCKWNKIDLHKKKSLMPKKITLLTNTLVSGGVEVLLLTLIRHLLSRGYQVQFISIAGGRLLKEVRSLPCLVNIYNEDISEDIFSLQHTGWCVKHLKSFEPDILMVFQFRPFLPGLIAGTLAGVPVMLKSENVSSDIAGPFIERQMTILEEMYDRVVAVSEAVKCRLHWLKDDKCKVIFGTNVETQVFSHIKINKVTDDRPLKFLTVARLAPEKGIEYLLQAADAVIKKGCKAHFSIVGEGKLHDSLIDLRDSLGLREHVEFLGYRNDIPDLLDKCDGFILPSLIEGLPLVIMEAMMAGRCVIATAVDGTPEIITHMENGLLVEPRNVEQLTSAIEMLSSNPELIPKLGEQARKKAQADLNADTMMDQLEALFQEEWAKKR